MKTEQVELNGINFTRKDMKHTMWDGGWFCENCWLIQHSKKPAYYYNNKKYCYKCANKLKED